MAELKLNQNLRMTQTQKLVLTQKIRQALEILQLPSLDLENMISTELQENPLIEADTEPRQEAPELPAETSQKTESEEAWDDEPFRSDSNERDPLDILRQIEEHMGESPSSSWSADDEIWRPEAVSQTSLSEHLLDQVYTMMLSPDLEEAVVYLVYSLDRHGLLSPPAYELEAGWDGDPAVLEEAKAIVRSLEPTGIGAATVVEALQMQLTERGYSPDDLEYRIVTSHFRDMAEKRLKEIARSEHVSPHEVQEAMDMIAGLNPWPGNQFSSGTNAAVIPDVIIIKIGDRYEAILNDNRFPRLTISARNRRILESPNTPDTEKEYVRKKYQRASWFIKAIGQRQETVTRIGRFLADFQRNFFEHGITGLRPLTLQMVADSLGNNQSTISRAINGKYIQSPRGIHEMRFFFSRALADDGGDISSRAVKDELRKLLESEDSAHPMSDASLAGALSAAGMEVKRRTVANYRTEMGFPSASKRKRY